MFFACDAEFASLKILYVNSTVGSLLVFLFCFGVNLTFLLLHSLFWSFTVQYLWFHSQVGLRSDIIAQFRTVLLNLLSVFSQVWMPFWIMSRAYF